jgi:predicted RNase H-like nuclease (RuvC/YqgF family)
MRQEVTMLDPKREAYLRLMAEIEELEEQVENFASEREMAMHSPDPQDAAILEEQTAALRVRLAEKRGELERLSDGCGRPHLWL